MSKCIGKKNFDLFYCVKAIFSYYSIVLCVNFNLSLGKNSMSVVNIAQKIAFGKKIPCKLRFCSQRQKVLICRPASSQLAGKNRTRVPGFQVFKNPNPLDAKNPGLNPGQVPGCNHYLCLNYTYYIP